MAQTVSEVGQRVYKGTSAENTTAVTPINIDTVKTIVLPAKPTSNTRGNLTKALLNGTLVCVVSVEGTSVARFTVNGVVPTTLVGELIPAPTATAPSKITLRGQDVISSFQIIGGAAGDSITYQFYISDVA